MSTKRASDPYCERLSTLFERDTKYGLEATRELAARFGNPQNNFKTVHIAGSNGKGSTALKIARALQHAGYKTGLYTSPHISSFRERIQINGQKIPEAALLHLLPDEYPGSFFEITTLLALRWFSEEKVDWAVIETGLGGRLDATNIIEPELAIITSISLEHTDILGTTLEEIAREKGGIFKPAARSLVGPKARFYPGVEAISGDFGTYDEENSAIAARALEILAVPQASIHYGIQLRPPCRFERVGERIILDVAHNPDGMKELVRCLKGQKVHIVLGMSKSKDVEACLQALNPAALSYIATEAASPRSLSALHLRQKIIESGVPPEKIELIPSPFDAVNRSLQRKGTSLITGSFFIMQEARLALGIEEERDFHPLNERVLPKRN